MSAFSRMQIAGIVRAAKNAEWVRRELARNRGELPGPSHYTNETLTRWGEEDSQRAFALAHRVVARA